MKANNPWDLLSDYFDTSKHKEEIPSHVADNICIAWPVLLKCIEKHSANDKKKKVLEYGCGSGGFADKLSQLGFKVTGVDSAKDMIKLAKKAYGEKIKFVFGDVNALEKLGQFDIITSVMTLQFINDIEKTMAAFAKALPANGLLIFAVHNPDCVKEGIQEGQYTKYDSKSQPKEVMLQFETGVAVPMFIRKADEYNTLAEKHKLHPLLEAYPPFTPEFIKKYPNYAGYKSSEYLILAYKKA